MSALCRTGKLGKESKNRQKFSLNRQNMTDNLM
jgi:hypothetical protein